MKAVGDSSVAGLCVLFKSISAGYVYLFGSFNKELTFRYPAHSYKEHFDK